MLYENLYKISLIINIPVMILFTYLNYKFYKKIKKFYKKIYSNTYPIYIIKADSDNIISNEIHNFELAYLSDSYNEYDKKQEYLIL